MNWSVGKLAEATSGTIAFGRREGRVSRLCTDTRALRPGDVFVALKGERFDGEEFIGAAFAKGAAGVVYTGARPPGDVPRGAFGLIVDDATRALGDAARAWRRELGLPIAAVTGSSGKTTTKEMVAHICRGVINLHATEGNFNNHIGLPLTLLDLRPDHDAAVVEVGMNHAGELARLAEIAEPDSGTVTLVGDAHIGNFADGQDGVIAAKAELLVSLGPGALAITNADCANSAIMRARYALPARRQTFGLCEDADVRAANVRKAKPLGYAFDLCADGGAVPVVLAVFGRYQVTNALAAASVALSLGVPLGVIGERLSSFAAPELRSQVLWIAGRRVVDDCYNASPFAMTEALRSFAEMADARRRYALLGDMHELGAQSEAGHREAGRVAAGAGLDGILVIGASARWIAEAATEAGAHPLVFEDTAHASAWIAETMQEGDALLVKASRAARLERVIDSLRAYWGGAGGVVAHPVDAGGHA